MCGLLRRDPHLLSGGACRDRTDDPLLAKQVLSQLSYGPVQGRQNTRSRFKRAEHLVYARVVSGLQVACADARNGLRL